MKVFEKACYFALVLLFLLGLAYQGETRGLEVVEVLNILVASLIIIQGLRSLKNYKKLGLIQLLIGSIIFLTILAN